MKKRNILKTIFMSFSLVLAGVVGTTAIYSYAIEQVENVYQISNEQDLIDFAAVVNGGETSANAVLTTNITLTAGTEIEIGSKTNKYNGTFDGRGFTISNYENSINKQYDSLFPYVTGTIKNVNLEGKMN